MISCSVSFEIRKGACKSVCALSSTVKITKGVVSSLAGKLRRSSGNDYSLIQFDAAIQSGNSGGPIVNERGNVVVVLPHRIGPPL